MFKKFIKRIIASKNREDAIDNVFYGTKWDEEGNIVVYGIDTAYIYGKITLEEHWMLLEIIGKMK